MFATNYFIDSVQSSKKYFVNNFIMEEKIRKPLNAFVDAQTAFTKQIFKSFEDVSSYINDEAKSTLEKATKVN